MTKNNEDVKKRIKTTKNNKYNNYKMTKRENIKIKSDSEYEQIYIISMIIK